MENICKDSVTLLTTNPIAYVSLRATSRANAKFIIVHRNLYSCGKVVKIHRRCKYIHLCEYILFDIRLVLICYFVVKLWMKYDLYLLVKRNVPMNINVIDS